MLGPAIERYQAPVDRAKLLTLVTNFRIWSIRLHVERRSSIMKCRVVLGKAKLYLRKAKLYVGEANSSAREDQVCPGNTRPQINIPSNHIQ